MHKTFQVISKFFSFTKDSCVKYRRSIYQILEKVFLWKCRKLFMIAKNWTIIKTRLKDNQRDQYLPILSNLQTHIFPSTEHCPTNLCLQTRLSQSQINRFPLQLSNKSHKKVWKITFPNWTQLPKQKKVSNTSVNRANDSTHVSMESGQWRHLPQPPKVNGEGIDQTARPRRAGRRPLRETEWRCH